MPIEPPATIAGPEVAVRDLHPDGLGGRVQRVDRDGCSAVRAPVPMSAAPTRTVKVPSASAVIDAVDGATPGGVRGGGHPGAQQPAPVAAQAGARVTVRPAEPAGPLFVAGDACCGC